MHEKKEKLVNLSGRLLARNALLNFIGNWLTSLSKCYYHYPHILASVVHL